MQRIRSCAAGAQIMIAAAVLATACAVGATWPVAASADGALAIGHPTDVASQGFAFGIVGNISTTAQASEQALALCRNAKGAAGSARSVCQVVQTLHQQCAAVAMDPATGTPGAGWAVALDKKTAETEAIQQCSLTAGSDRQSYCAVSVSMCDTSIPREHGQ